MIEEGERSESKLFRRGRKIKYHKCSMVGHNSISCQTSSRSSMRVETMVISLTKCTNKRKGRNNKETVGGTQESSNTKKAMSKDLTKHNRKSWR
ncbi:hypothetical protein J1N35_037273 [Gossypium stocksii]|uniref:Uncharacterized protein n=1 Tax=Gossypium stocksii TaxID=47602 RepID=A0A9D3ZLI8_9ROSI|nr:hypothetical protein J1N35_037273 [Gossypium stocksii]